MSRYFIDAAHIVDSHIEITGEMQDIYSGFKI